MRLWIAMTLAAVGLAGGTWWLTNTPTPLSPDRYMRSWVDSSDNPPPQPTEISSPVPDSSRRFHIRPTGVDVRSISVEPIAVYVETEGAVESAPALLPPVVTATAVSDRLVPRPEAGIEPVPFMPYAEEDAEVARLRRESRERLARQTAEPPLLRPIRELQETAEPPLSMPNLATTWRPNGKLPCSVK
jgi:hypothetical protein